MCSVAQPCLTVAPQTAAHQTTLPTEFFRQEYWNGLPFPTPGDLPNPGIEPVSFVSPALAGGFFTTSIIIITLIILHLFQKYNIISISMNAEFLFTFFVSDTDRTIKFPLIFFFPYIRKIRDLNYRVFISGNI